MFLVVDEEKEEDATGTENNDDSWLNASSNSLVLTMGGSSINLSNGESFAEYGDVAMYRLSSSNDNNDSSLLMSSSFASNDKVPWPLWLDSSASTVDLVHNTDPHDSASSFDLAQLFKEEEHEMTVDDQNSKRVRFGTVTVREFSLVYENDRLTLDWDHTPDVVTSIPDIQAGSHPRRLTFSQQCNRLLVVRGWTLSRRNLLTIDEEESTEREFKGDKEPGTFDRT